MMNERLTAWWNQKALKRTLTPRCFSLAYSLSLSSSNGTPGRATSDVSSKKMRLSEKGIA